MRTTHVFARVLIDVGCSKVCRVVHDQRDFLECHTTDHLTKDRSMHLEGKTNGDARGREIATCATVGAEIQTCIRRLVRAWPLEPTSGRGAVSPRSPGIPRVSQWAIPKMRGHWIQAKKCKAGRLRRSQAVSASATPAERLKRSCFMPHAQHHELSPAPQLRHKCPPPPATMVS